MKGVFRIDPTFDINWCFSFNTSESGVYTKGSKSFSFHPSLTVKKKTQRWSCVPLDSRDSKWELDFGWLFADYRF